MFFVIAKVMRSRHPNFERLETDIQRYSWGTEGKWLRCVCIAMAVIERCCAACCNERAVGTGFNGNFNGGVENVINAVKSTSITSGKVCFGWIELFAYRHIQSNLNALAYRAGGD